MLKDSNFISFTRYLEKHGLELINIIVNGILYASTGILFSMDKANFWNTNLHSKKIAFGILFIGAIYNIFFYFKQSSKSKSIQDLKNDSDQYQTKIQILENQIQKIHRNYSDIFNEHLAYLFIKLNLKDSERINMYKYDNEKFYLIGRYSTNPTLKKVRRRSYKANQGLISKAWKESDYFLNSGVPDYGKKARERKRSHDFFNKISPIDKAIFEAITMKSKSFYLKSLMDSKNINKTSIIVIESENTKAFIKSEIDKIIQEEEAKLNSFVDKIEWNFPKVDNAQNTGF